MPREAVKLPNADRAVVDIAKLRDYCLSTRHPRGRHKARVFAAVLGLTVEHAETFRAALALAARTEAVTSGESDVYGDRYMLDFWMNGPTGGATVRSTWIVRRGEDFPRLTSCYVM